MPETALPAQRLADWLQSRRWRRGLAALAAGMLAALGQAPLGFWPLTLVGLAVGFGLLRLAPTTRRAALTGWVFGSGYFGLTLVWIVQPFLVDIARHGWMAPFALTFMAGGMALFWAAGFALARWLAPDGRRGWLAFAVAMGAAELARGTVLTGFPWGGPGLAWIDTMPAQLASVVGAFGLTVLTFAGGGALWSATTRRGVLPIGVVAAGFALAFGTGLLLARDEVPDRGAEVTLRLIQPNAAQHLKWDPDWVGVFLDRTLALTAEPTDGPAPDLVIWPETAVPSVLGQYPELQSRIAATASPARLIAGIRRYDGTRVYNSLVLFDADGAAEAIYDKHHVVPFGEYVPLGDLLGRFGIQGLATREGYGYSAGPGAAVMALPEGLGKALPLICYEAIFPRDLRAAPERADWILQITNDAWFGTFSGPQQHLVQARFRAIELGLPFVRAANTGISAVIDARGRVLGSLPLGTAGHLDATLPGALAPTVYARWGDAPVVLLLILSAAGLIMTRRAKAIDPFGAAQ
jgi:apolipoprotein N-acyltransferase